MSPVEEEEGRRSGERGGRDGDSTTTGEGNDDEPGELSSSKVTFAVEATTAADEDVDHGRDRLHDDALPLGLVRVLRRRILVARLHWIGHFVSHKDRVENDLPAVRLYT